MTAGSDLDLPAAVSRLLGDTVTGIEDVAREPLDYDAFLAGRSLARYRGTAEVGGEPVPWSFVEKRTDGPAVASEYLYDNGRREFAAYRSGLLDDLAPGLRAPRLLAAAEDADGGLRLWIEDLAAGGRQPLDEEHILRAARGLGRLAGRWIERNADEPWLFRGWIDRHRQPEAIAGGLAVITDARRDPQLARRIGGRLDEAIQLVDEQDFFASVLADLTPTLCHHDAVAANVFAAERDGKRETVLIDWESLGPGPAGADLASLLFASPRRGDFSARLLPRLMRRALSAYAEGMTEMGASPDSAELRLGLHASVALRWTLVRDVILLLADPSRARRGSARHETSDEALAELTALVPVLLDSAAEARRLMSSGG